MHRSIHTMKEYRRQEQEAYRRYNSGEVPNTATGMADGELNAGYGDCDCGYFLFPLQVDQETGEILK